MKAAFVLAMTLALTGCAVQKDWSATGGSRSDGVVRLSYEVAEMEKAIVDEKQAVAIATRRCSAWGYTGAEAFGGATSQCVQAGQLSSCGNKRVTKEYQCTGQAPAAQPK